MQQEPFLALCKRRNFEETYVRQAIEDLKTFEVVLNRLGNGLDTCTENQLKDYIGYLIQQKQNTLERFLTFARYFYVVGRIDLYRYFLAILGGLGVIESMKKRTELLTNSEIAEEIFSGVDFPALGSPIDENPVITVELLKRLRKKLPDEVFKKVLAGNHHEIPASHFEKDKEKFIELNYDIDAFLKYNHDRQVAELDEYCREGKIWYEQMLTPEVVQYVREHPEIQGGVREGNVIYLTKIPFEPARYIKETDPDMKRYYACHCPFVRSSLLLNEEKVVPEWCYCSAGFEKQVFDAIYGKELRVEVLETPFKGDIRCRFAVHID
jgi:hypothetical protein